MQLSKSDYMMFLKHPAWLWLKKHDKDKLPPIDPGLQAMFDAGHAFEPYAESLFQNSVTVGFDFNDRSRAYNTMPARTKAVLDDVSPFSTRPWKITSAPSSNTTFVRAGIVL